MRELYNFKTGLESNPVEKLLETEDLQVDQNTRERVWTVTLGTNVLFPPFLVPSTRSGFWT